MLGSSQFRKKHARRWQEENHRKPILILAVEFWGANHYIPVWSLDALSKDAVQEIKDISVGAIKTLNERVATKTAELAKKGQQEDPDVLICMASEISCMSQS